MFAVKGWSVDASSLKPQTEPFKGPTTAGLDIGQKQGRKRKRRKAHSQPEERKPGELREDEVKKTLLSTKASKTHKPEGGAAAKFANGDRSTDGLQEKDLRQTESTFDALQKSGGARTTKKKRKLGSEQQRVTSAQGSAIEDGNPQDVTSTVVPPPVLTKLTPMQSAMRQKLVSARFRHLNQTLYTAPSKDALQLFDENPDMFHDYHAGFRQQVSVWPENPIDNFIATLRTRGAVRAPKHQKETKLRREMPGSGSLPRTQGISTIADLGCGDARLAQTLKDSSDTTKLNLKILSYDLHSLSRLVTKADIANVPQPEGSVDIAIFCLALMGTNWISFIEEAYRILHWKGELWIAEIKSRFGRVGRAGKPVVHSVGGKKKQAASRKAQEAKQKEDEETTDINTLRTEVDGVETKPEETNVAAFVNVLRRRGFLLKDGDSSIDLSNKMFVQMEFIKAAPPTKGKCATGKDVRAPAKKKFIDEQDDEVMTDDEAKVLKPCLYKIR